jgi:hypothetical protein
MPPGAVGALTLIQIIKTLGLVDAAQPLLQPRLQLLAHLPHQLTPFFEAAGLGLG